MAVFSPDYEQDCLNCATPGSFSSVWMIVSRSNLLNIPIESVYPAVNGSQNLYFRTLNTKFKPPFSDPEKGHLTIMWTSTTPPTRPSWTSRRPRKTQEWCPNHFVPLVDLQHTEHARLPDDARKNQLPSRPSIEENTNDNLSNFSTRNRFESLLAEDRTVTTTDQTKTIVNTSLPQGALNESCIQTSDHTSIINTTLPDEPVNESCINKLFAPRNNNTSTPLLGKRKYDFLLTDDEGTKVKVTRIDKSSIPMEHQDTTVFVPANTETQADTTSLNLNNDNAIEAQEADLSDTATVSESHESSYAESETTQLPTPDCVMK